MRTKRKATYERTWRNKKMLALACRSKMTLSVGQFPIAKTTLSTGWSSTSVSLDVLGGNLFPDAQHRVQVSAATGWWCGSWSPDGSTREKKKMQKGRRMRGRDREDDAAWATRRNGDLASRRRWLSFDERDSRNSSVFFIKKDRQSVGGQFYAKLSK